MDLRQEAFGMVLRPRTLESGTFRLRLWLSHVTAAVAAVSLSFLLCRLRGAPPWQGTGSGGHDTCPHPAQLGFRPELLGLGPLLLLLRQVRATGLYFLPREGSRTAQ